MLRRGRVEMKQNQTPTETDQTSIELQQNFTPLPYLGLNITNQDIRNSLKTTSFNHHDLHR